MEIQPFLYKPIPLVVIFWQEKQRGKPPMGLLPKYYSCYADVIVLYSKWWLVLERPLNSSAKIEGEPWNKLFFCVHCPHEDHPWCYVSVMMVVVNCFPMCCSKLIQGNSRSTVALLVILKPKYKDSPARFLCMVQQKSEYETVEHTSWCYESVIGMGQWKYYEDSSFSIVTCCPRGIQSSGDIQMKLKNMTRLLKCSLIPEHTFILCYGNLKPWTVIPDDPVHMTACFSALKAFQYSNWLPMCKL